ncbi:hypothetical protein Q8G38_15865 [Halomonas venusta]|uniref:hypothetical protein n=1 Tax=Vreelandella venusta TaxID=44935 RepID=UPI00295EE91A|nr:hypothetical protein [Halomonas venusta]MDW0360789.1 hypothetical protein [Halomonas venusta]
MNTEHRKIDHELIARNCKAIGAHARQAFEEADKAFKDFAEACSKIDLEKMRDHRRHD